MSSFLTFIAVIPVILILLFVYNKDRNKEPTKLLVKLFFFGIVSCLLTLAITKCIEMGFPIFKLDESQYTFMQLVIYVFIVIALVEEFSKWIMAFLIGYKSEEFDEMFDSIVYAVFVSLGFALFENILYVFVHNSFMLGIFRGILSVPGHACYGLYMGYFLAKAKVASKKGRVDLETKYMILSIIVPTLLHGIYDFCLLSDNSIYLLVFIVFVIGMFTFSVINISNASKNNYSLERKNKYCSNCGNEMKGTFCNKCGTRQE